MQLMDSFLIDIFFCLSKVVSFSGRTFSKLVELAERRWRWRRQPVEPAATFSGIEFRNGNRRRPEQSPGPEASPEKVTFVCGTKAEHLPRELGIVGLNPAGRWAFFSFYQLFNVHCL